MKSFNFYIRTKQDLIDAVEACGIVPLFANSVPGFSVEEHVSPDVWFADGEGVWEWKGPVIRESGCAYGKFFEHKAAFVSRAWFPDLANYRRDGYDFEGYWEDGLSSFKEKELFELLERSAPVLSTELKRRGNYGRDGRKGFDTIINKLQARCFVLIADFYYPPDRFGRPYGWGTAVYSTPEVFMGEEFVSRAYLRAPEESFGRVLGQLRTLLPDTDEAVLRRFLR